MQFLLKMSKKVKITRSSIFNFLSVVVLVVTVYLVLFGKTLSDNRGWILFAFAALCALIGNLDKIENLKLSRDGIEAKMREANQVVDEAKTVLAELHKFAELTGSLFVNMLSGEGRLGGRDPIDIEEQKGRILKLLKSIGINEEALKSVEMSDKKYIVFDYAYGIVRKLQKSTEPTTEQHKTAKAMLETWNGNNLPTPQYLSTLFKQIGVTDPEFWELVEDYKYYVENGEQRRLSVWLSRRTWAE